MYCLTENPYYGLRNMAGNILEWTHDWYRQNFCDYCDPTGEDYFMDAAEIICGGKAFVEIKKKASVEIKEGPEVPPRNNPRGPLVGIFRVLRGGSWQDMNESAITVSHRFWLDPLERYAYTGFRCAATDKKDRKEDKDEKPPAEDDLSAYITCKPKEVAVPVAVPEEKPAEVAELPVLAPPVVPEPSSFEDIYFDYDRYEIRADSKLILKAVDDWLLRNPGARILIEGHCDERGTNEYNLALGERRASITRKYLTGMGISGERLETISYGEEKPFCLESNELCWQKNRRAHLVIIKKDAGGPDR